MTTTDRLTLIQDAETIISTFQERLSYSRNNARRFAVDLAAEDHIVLFMHALLVGLVLLVAFARMAFIGWEPSDVLVLAVSGSGFFYLAFFAFWRPDRLRFFAKAAVEDYRRDPFAPDLICEIRPVLQCRFDEIPDSVIALTTDHQALNYQQTCRALSLIYRAAEHVLRAKAQVERDAKFQSLCEERRREDA